MPHLLRRVDDVLLLVEQDHGAGGHLLLLVGLVVLQLLPLPPSMMLMFASTFAPFLFFLVSLASTLSAPFAVRVRHSQAGQEVVLVGQRGQQAGHRVAANRWSQLVTKGGAWLPVSPSSSLAGFFFSLNDPPRSSLLRMFRRAASTFHSMLLLLPPLLLFFLEVTFASNAISSDCGRVCSHYRSLSHALFRFLLTLSHGKQRHRKVTLFHLKALSKALFKGTLQLKGTFNCAL